MYELGSVLLYLYHGNDIRVLHTNKFWYNMRRELSIKHIVIIGLTIWEFKIIREWKWKNNCEKFYHVIYKRDTSEKEIIAHSSQIEI
jgi:hypothetical protein